MCPLPSFSGQLQPSSPHSFPNPEPLHRPTVWVWAALHQSSRSKPAVSRSRGQTRPHQRRPAGHELLHLQLPRCEFPWLVVFCRFHILNWERVKCECLHICLKLPLKLLLSHKTHCSVICRTQRTSTASVYVRSGAVLTVTSTCLWLHWSACSTRPPAGQKENSRRKVRNTHIFSYFCVVFLPTYTLANKFHNKSFECKFGWIIFGCFRARRWEKELFLSIGSYKSLSLRRL